MQELFVNTSLANRKIPAVAPLGRCQLPKLSHVVSSLQIVRLSVESGGHYGPIVTLELKNFGKFTEKSAFMPTIQMNLQSCFELLKKASAKV